MLLIYLVLQLIWRRDFLLHGTPLKKNSWDFNLCLWLALLYLLSYFWSLYWPPSSSVCWFFYSVSSNKDEVLSISPSAKVFVCEDFKVHHKGWLIYSTEIDRPLANSCNFYFSKNLIQMVKFPIQILDCDSHSPALLDLFISSDTSICSTMPFPPLGNSDHVVVSVSIDFLSNSKRDTVFDSIGHDSWFTTRFWIFTTKFIVIMNLFTRR